MPFPALLFVPIARGVCVPLFLCVDDYALCEQQIRILPFFTGLDDAIGLELVTLVTDKDGEDHVYQVAPFSLKGREGNRYTFTVSHSMDNAGSFKVCYRMYPKTENLPHRQDFCYVKWFA